MENNLLVRLPGQTWLDTRRSQLIKAVRPEPSPIHPEIFQHGVVETLPRIGESKGPRFAGSASEYAGWIKTFVARISLADIRESEWLNSPEENSNKTLKVIEEEATKKVINVSLATVENTQPIGTSIGSQHEANYFLELPGSSEYSIE